VADANDPREFGDFSSRNEDRVTTEMMPMLSDANLVKLPKGQAFALLNGNVLHKLRLPLLLPEEGLAIPRGWDEMLDHMERKYAEYVRHAESAPLVDTLVREGQGSGF
jgi:conjugal transfer pilus assembly protein TraD